MSVLCSKFSSVSLQTRLSSTCQSSQTHLDPFSIPNTRLSWGFNCDLCLEYFLTQLATWLTAPFCFTVTSQWYTTHLPVTSPSRDHRFTLPVGVSLRGQARPLIRQATLLGLVSQLLISFTVTSSLWLLRKRMRQWSEDSLNYQACSHTKISCLPLCLVELMSSLLPERIPPCSLCLSFCSIYARTLSHKQPLSSPFPNLQVLLLILHVQIAWVKERQKPPIATKHLALPLQSYL